MAEVLSKPAATLEGALKAAVEAIAPDLRRHMRLSLMGKVTAAHDDDYLVDVVIGEPPEALSLPRVPVSALWAQDGYGVWALPEVDAEVTVSFHEGDVTRPYVEAPGYGSNRAPSGFKAGSFAIRGKQGQKLELKPDVNEIVLSAHSLKIIATGAVQTYAGGADRTTVGGEQHGAVAKSRTLTIGASDSVESASRSRKVKGASREEYGSLTVNIKGAEERRISGNRTTVVGGHCDEKVLGTKLFAAAGARKEIIGGAWSVLAGNGPIPALDAISLKAATGNVSINSLAGLIRIGGDTAISPAVLGAELVAQLAALVQIFSANAAAFTGPVAVGSPAQLNPAVVTALQTWAASLTAAVLSQAVFLKRLPVG